MKTKFTFAIAILCLVFSAQAQITQTCFSETFSTQTAGWTYSQGASEGSYTSPVGCVADRGIVTPGVGGNNPANIITPNFVSTGALTVQLAFDIFCVNSNLACNSWRNFGCPTSIDVFYYVGTTKYVGITDLVLPANGPLNSPTVSFNFAVGNNLPAGTLYKIEVAFKPKSGIGNCGQPGTKYVLDNFKKCEITCANCAIDAINDNFCFDTYTSETISGNLSLNDSKYAGANVTYSLANGPFANGNSVTGGAILVINADGTFTLTRTDPTKSSFDFTYKVGDNLLSFSDLGSATVCFPVASLLPVRLSSFSAARKEANAVLNWITSSEINVQQFEIERSINGKFIKTGSVPASNNTNGYSYLFSEKNTSVTPTQYRLKIVDRDGKVQYSETKTVKGMADINDHNVFPNPTNGAVSLSIDNLAGLTNVQLLDNMGRLVSNQNVNSGVINISGFGKGIYFVRFAAPSSGEKIIKKLVIN